MPVPTGSTFEADLRAVREDRGLSLDEIQQQTRIPVDVLRRFEEGDLVDDPTYNAVYLKAFLQSYAKAVGLPTSDVLAAYDAHKAGSYDDSLRSGAGSGEAPAPPQAAPPEPAPEVPPAADETEAPPEPTAKKPAPGPRGSSAPAVEALATTPSPEASSRPQPPASVSQTRVSRPAVPTARRSFDKNWGTILGLFAVVVVVLAAALWFLVFAGNDEPEADGTETVAVGNGQEIDVDSSSLATGAAAGGPQLQLPISVTVTAGGNGLQWFRVTEDADERTPYWIDQDASQTFEADSSLVLWGEGNEADAALAFDEATFEMQGLRFTPPDGRVLRITRSNGQRFLDSLATAGSDPAAAPASEAAVPAPSPDAYE